VSFDGRQPLADAPATDQIKLRADNRLGAVYSALLEERRQGYPSSTWHEAISASYQAPGQKPHPTKDNERRRQSSTDPSHHRCVGRFGASLALSQPHTTMSMGHRFLPVIRHWRPHLTFVAGEQPGRGSTQNSSQVVHGYPELAYRLDWWWLR
jgi:hypothetical protein